ncbi:MAG: hypothetical protein Q7R92_01760 [bacterium]|nr:hypothetical protein [bacterium]
MQEKEIEKKVENYVGPEGISTRELEAGLWYVEHRQKLKWALYGALILIGAVSWSYTIYGFAYYLARGMSEDQTLARQLAQADSVSHDNVLAASARPLTLSPVEIIRFANNKYDLAAPIKNDNPRWWAKFDYYFASAAGRTEQRPGYILPLEDKYLLALARDFTGEPADARLVMENLSWRRLSAKQIPDWRDYYKKHLDIETADVKFIPAGAGDLAGKLNLNQLSFKAINRTAYNFWQAGFTILLVGGGGLVGVNHYVLDNFMSGQEAPVALNWPGNLGTADRVEIIPEINIMEDDIYIPYEGGVGQEK